MYKIFNIVMISIFIFFIFFIFQYYFSNKNINSNKYNRSNINEILEEKIVDLPILLNDTNNVIDYFSSELEEKKIKKRYFWELFKK